MKKYGFINDNDGSSSESVSVTKTKKRKLDIVPRIVCILFAIAIWVYMVNLNDTDVEETFTVTVEIVGEEALHSSGMAIYGMDSRTATITVKGSNRDLRKYSEQDYKVTIDVSTISSSGKQNIKLNVVTPQNSSIECIKTEPSSIALFSDINLEKDIPLNIEFGDVITYPNAEPIISQSADMVKIAGPNAIVDKIEYATYHVNGDLDSSVMYSGFSLEFFDKNHEVIDASNYDYISYSTKDITVNVDVLLHRSIQIRFNMIDDASGYTAYTDKAHVNVYGDRLLIKQFEDLSYVITLSKVDSDFIYYPLTDDVLPDGVFIEDTEVGRIKITFTKNPDVQSDTEAEEKETKETD